ncbi:MAG: arylamine N-acetyltransferase [Candidatus Berkiella sp.]
MAIDLDLYFKRIGYQGSRELNSQTLINIHRQQSLTIPLDMLDHHLGVPLSLEPEFIFNKLLRHKRGGGCSQLNEVLALALIALGFKVDRLMARVFYDLEKDQAPILSHKMLRVTFNNETWICDCGFYCGLIEPIPLVLDTQFDHCNRSFILTAHEEHGIMFKTKIEDKWIEMYAFNLTTYIPEDYKAIFSYNCINPDRPFYDHAIVTMNTIDGKKVLYDRTFEKKSGKKTTVINIRTCEQYHAILKEEFNIEIPEHPNFFPDPMLMLKR